MLLAACAQDAAPAGPFFGGAAAEEPRAATVARDVLEQGGNAADGAVAAFFAMTATYPAAASPGGGGICLVHRPDPAKSEMLDFPVRKAARGGTIGVPAAVPAMYALHARYGRLRWANVLVPGEQLARFGHPMSRAAATAVRATSLGLLDTAASIYGAPGGDVLQEGQTFRNPALGATIGRLRTTGPQELHRGQLARLLLEDIAGAGGQVDEQDLRAMAPVWSAPITIEYDNSQLLVANNVAGEVFRDLWTDLVREPGLWRRASVDRSHFLDAIGKANRRFGASPPIGSDNTAGIVVADRDGMVVACGFTMGPPFGAQRYGKATGIMLAAAPKDGIDQQQLLLPIIGASPNIKQVFLGAVATGGALAPAAAFETIAQIVPAQRRAPEALASPRVFWAGPGSIMLFENGTSREMVADAHARGIDQVMMQAIGQVNLLHCTEALPRVPQSCGFRADPRGFGLGAGGGF
ncbi:gamma-glutamyltransferase [Desertibaculum subflavum]|uniref:gamma-glutamyltransferase n=1 Tax=Desertibaculum subflavum TaxID=2268458 RepID=UPI000E662765